MDKKKRFKCPFCPKVYVTTKGEYALYIHMADEHLDELNGLPAEQVYFNARNRYSLTKGNGLSVVSGKPTPFNMVTKRYERFLPSEKEKYVAILRARTKKVHGVEHLLKDKTTRVEQENKMLKARSISGVYEWLDGGKTDYVGSYEKSFLEYLDSNGFRSYSVLAPAPQVFPYILDGEERVHIPDFYVPSVNLLVQIKASDNKHYRLRDIEKEKAIDHTIANDGRFNYIKIYDKQNEHFLQVVQNIVDRLNNGNTKPVIVDLKK